MTNNNATLGIIAIVALALVAMLGLVIYFSRNTTQYNYNSQNPIQTNQDQLNLNLKK